MILKMKKPLIVYIILIMFFSFSVEAYEIYVAEESEYLRFEDIKGANLITLEGNLESNILAILYVDDDYLKNHLEVDISFDPWERMTSAPIEEFSVNICRLGNQYGFDWQTGFPMKDCLEKYNYTLTTSNNNRYYVSNGKLELKNYPNYRIHFNPEFNTSGERFAIIIYYKTPTFIFEQGDYQVANLFLPNMKEKQIENSIVLPAESDIPRFLPNAKESKREPYHVGDKIFYRWAFIFEGDGDKTIWFWNDKEAKAAQNRTNRNNLILGAILGFIASIIAGVITYYLSKRLEENKWKPYEETILRKFNISTHNFISFILDFLGHKPDITPEELNSEHFPSLYKIKSFLKLQELNETKEKLFDIRFRVCFREEKIKKQIEGLLEYRMVLEKLLLKEKGTLTPKQSSTIEELEQEIIEAESLLKLVEDENISIKNVKKIAPKFYLRIIKLLNECIDEGLIIKPEVDDDIITIP